MPSDYNEEQMDRWLRDAMSPDPPQLSPAFDDRVLRAVRPRRLTKPGRVTIAAYAVAATALTVWSMRDLDLLLIAATAAVTVSVAVGASAYGRHLSGVGN